MKKILFFVMLLCFAAVVSASDFYGDPVRAESMGGHKIALIDATTISDLYSMGYSSGIFARPKKSFIQLLPGLGFNMFKSVEDDISDTTRTNDLLGISNGDFISGNEGAQIWLSNESVVVVKPYLSGFFGQYKRSYPGTPLTPDAIDDETYYLLGGALEFSQKVAGNIAVSGSAGYVRKGLAETDREDGDKSDSYIDKLELALSAAMLPDSAEGLALAVNIGNKTAPLPVLPYTVSLGILSEIDYVGSIFNYLYGAGYYSEYESPAGTLNKNTYSTITSGLTADIGASMSATDGSVLSGKAGIIAGYKQTDKEKLIDKDISTGEETVTSEGEDVSAENGLGVYAELNARKNLGGFTAGARGSVNSLGFKIPGSDADRRFTVFSADAGICIGQKGGIQIPVEFFTAGLLMTEKDGDNYEEDIYYDFGVRAGAEIPLGKDFAARLGVDYGLFADYSLEKTGDTITDQSAPSGSAANPYYAQLGINAGLGLKIEGMEINLGARIEPFWRSPKSDGYTEWSDMKISGKAGVRIPL